MQLVTRSDLRWPATAAVPLATARGVKVHYLGTDVGVDVLADHQRCLQLWADTRASHLANEAEGYVDVAYNLAACVHGYVLEGRGVGRRSGANGGGQLNSDHYAVVALIGDEGVTEPTDALLHALRDAIAYLRANGAGVEILGHRDGYATSCPGGPLYAWVQAGAPRPEGGVPQTPAPPVPVPAAPRFPGRLMVVASPMLHGDDVRDWQRRMAERGWSIGVDGWYGPGSARVARAFQEEKRLVADGVVGPATWDAAFRTDNVT